MKNGNIGIKLLTVGKKTMHKRSSFFIVFLTLLILIFIVLTYFVRKYTYFPFDLVITRSIQSINFPFFDSYMKFLTFLGNNIPATVLTIAVILVLLVAKRWREGALLLISVLGIEILSFTIKNTVLRARPSAELVKQFVQYTGKDSFPSGHVLFYLGFFGFLLFLVYTNLQKTRLQKGLVVLFIILMISIGLSRIYLGAHWFTDVIGAYIVGFLWLCFMIYLHKKFILEKKK